MGGKKREYDDDDGRTIVDMSQVSRPHLYTAPRPQNEFPKSEKKAPRRTVSEDRPWEDTSMTKSERRMYMLGALKAVLLIALVYIVGLGGLIAGLIAWWSR